MNVLIFYSHGSISDKIVIQVNMTSTVRSKVEHKTKTNSVQRVTKVNLFLHSMEEVTYSLASAGFIGISLLQILSAIFASFYLNVNGALSNALGSSVCIIAAFHYQWMRRKINDSSKVVATRYSDWYITTILMLIEFFNLAGTLETKWGWLLGACLSCELMILGGHAATVLRENDHPFILMFSASVFFSFTLLTCYIFGTVVDVRHENHWMHIFSALWALYPFAFWSGRFKNIFYNILDIYSKGIFGLILGILTFLDN